MFFNTISLFFCQTLEKHLKAILCTQLDLILLSWRFVIHVAVIFTKMLFSKKKSPTSFFIVSNTIYLICLIFGVDKDSVLDCIKV